MSIIVWAKRSYVYTDVQVNPSAWDLGEPHLLQSCTLKLRCTIMCGQIEIRKWALWNKRYNKDMKQSTILVWLASAPS